MMTANDLEATLAAIANKAKALRESGVVGTITIGDISFELAGDAPPPAAPSVLAAPAAPELPAIDDGDTYGGYVPQRRRRTAPPDEHNEE